MARRFTDKTIVVASHNPGKVREIAELLQPFGVGAVPAAELHLGEPEETGSTFAENAAIKALAGAREAGLPALADDSGLVVPALGGAPGIRSARWAGQERDFRLAMRRLEEALGDRNPSAHFTAALVLAWPDGHMECFEGKVFGRLVWPGRGERGFGYDPIFLADGQNLTFGEMEPAEKHRISHRAVAFERLVAACFETG
ncbi:MAG: RdgB/HAM1 family non-canonical purine NTP pyrophosphatase [Sphingomonadales bacterium]